MNYVKHLNQWFEVVYKSEDITPIHIALYVMLFNLWNQSHFAPFIVINRQEMITLTRIGSMSTYSKCMRELHEKGWIQYLPSTSKYGSSKVVMLPLDRFAIEALPTLPRPTYTKASSATSTTSSSATSKLSTSDTSSNQEVGHLLKTTNNQHQKTNTNSSPLKNKFHEPL